MEKGSCIGMLTERDLALDIAHNPLGHPRRLVRELTDGTPTSVDIRTQVAEVAGTLLATGQDAVPMHIARHARGESVTAIARHLGLGRSTLYRALGEPQPT